MAAASIDDLAFELETLDVIWAEDSIDNMGLEHGIRSGRPFLKCGGVLATTEIS